MILILLKNQGVFENVYKNADPVAATVRYILKGLIYWKITLQFLERIAIDLKFKEDQHHVDCRYFQANLQIIQINVADCQMF